MRESVEIRGGKALWAADSECRPPEEGAHLCGGSDPVTRPGVPGCHGRTVEAAASLPCTGRRSKRLQPKQIFPREPENAPRLSVFLGSTKDRALPTPEGTPEVTATTAGRVTLWDRGRPGRHLLSSQARGPVLSSANNPPRASEWDGFFSNTVPVPGPEHTELLSRPKMYFREGSGWDSIAVQGP